MERILYDREGRATAYFAEDFHGTIYLWEGLPTAYLFKDEHVYGINGRHLGWFKDEVLFNHDGERVGFTHATCPVSVVKPPQKWKKSTADELRPRWTAPPSPKLLHRLGREDLASFLKKGLIRQPQEESSAEPAA
jgi:hypothetical protein